ncbi:MAG TPA: hypothetical protein VJN71_00575 [Nitrososphaerales archaeon]|nr:hypothetical protein [Nitrososphaerales archaeon]
MTVHSYGVSSAYNVTAIAKRPVIARLWQQSLVLAWTLGKTSDTPSSIGIAIGQLVPSWVSEVIYIGAPGGTGKLTSGQIANYNSFRNAVKQYAPNCVFDVMISEATSRNTPPRNPVPIMETINSEISVNGFSFDYWWNLKQYPAIYESAINYAHSKGQFVAGASIHQISNVYPGEDIALSGIPSNLATLTTQDINFVQKVHVLLGNQYPVVFHIASNPLDANGRYWFKISTAQKEQEIASQVASIYTMGSGVSYLYSVVNPESQVDVSYDAFHDGSMMSVIANLMNKYTTG